MKSFEQLARLAFEAYENSSHGNTPSLDAWERLHPELKAHWVATARAIVAQYSLIH